MARTDKQQDEAFISRAILVAHEEGYRLTLIGPAGTRVKTAYHSADGLSGALAEIEWFVTVDPEAKEYGQCLHCKGPIGYAQLADGHHWGCLVPECAWYFRKREAMSAAACRGTLDFVADTVQMMDAMIAQRVAEATPPRSKPPPLPPTRVRRQLAVSDPDYEETLPDEVPPVPPRERDDVDAVDRCGYCNEVLDPRRQATLENWPYCDVGCRELAEDTEDGEKVRAPR